MQQPRAVAADQSNTDIAALQTQIKQLRSDLAKVAQTMREIASNGVVGREIEERPIASALTAFGTGVLLGLLLNRRRG